VIARAAGRSRATLDSRPNWRASVEAYLSPKHVRDRATGCPFAALGGDVPRESETIRTAFSEALERSIEALAARLGQAGEGAGREEAIQALATMVGALVLARTAATPRLRDEILSAARNGLLEAPRT
jgi:TetR/AcrR family transcriptional repressor of nem operon